MASVIESLKLNKIISKLDDKEYIFPGMWLILHLVAMKTVEDEDFDEVYATLIHVFKTYFTQSLFVKFIEENPVDDYVNGYNKNNVRIGLFKHSWMLHNYINDNIGKAHMRFKLAYNIYDSLINGPAVCSENCHDYVAGPDEFISNPVYSGPGLWIVFHLTSYLYVYDKESYREYRRIYIMLMYLIAESHPCGECRHHAPLYLEENPPKKSRNIFKHSSDFHNAVSFRINGEGRTHNGKTVTKEELTYEEAVYIFNYIKNVRPSIRLFSEVTTKTREESILNNAIKFNKRNDYRNDDRNDEINSIVSSNSSSSSDEDGGDLWPGITLIDV